MQAIIINMEEFIIAKRLHTAILAVMTSVFVMRCIGGSVSDPLLLAVAFFLVWGVYLENLISDKGEDRVNNPCFRESGTYSLERFYLLMYFLGLACAFLISAKSFLLAIAAVMIFLSYNHPWLFVGRDRKIRLKQVFIIKNIIPPAGWVLAVAVIPFVHLGIEYRAEYLLLLFLIFIFGVREEIKFDIPDVEGDRLAGIRTLPNFFGEPATRAILDGLSCVLVILLFASFLLLNKNGMVGVNRALIENVFPFLLALLYDGRFIDRLYEIKGKKFCDLGILWWIFLLAAYFAVPFPLNILLILVLRVGGGLVKI